MPTEELEQVCRNDPQLKEVFAPAVGQVLNVSAATNIYRVKLRDALVSSLQFAKVRL